MTETATSPLRHGFVLTYGPTDNGRLLAICSDGSPQLGHEDVTVLTLEVVPSVEAAKLWFARVCAERPWEARH